MVESISPLGVTGPRRPRFYSISDVAAILGTSEATLYRAIRAGEFPAIKIRGRYVIPSRALDAMEDEAVTTGSVVDPAELAAERERG